MKRKFTYLNSIKSLVLLSISFMMGQQAFAQTYCYPNIATCSNGTHIVNVTVGYINNNTSGCSTTDYTSQIDTIIAGVSKPMEVTTTWYGGYGVYVDLNNDGDFDDANEFINGDYISNSTNQLYNLTLSVPVGTPAGPHRLRVLGVWGWTMQPGEACADYDTVGGGHQYGNFEDYTLFVADTSCPTISTQPLTQTICDGTTASLSVASSTGYNWTYQWYKDGQPISNSNTGTYNIPNFSPSDAGDYYATVTDGCVMAPTATSNTATLSFKALPNATATAAGPIRYCPGNGVILNAGAGQDYQYQWLFNGNPITGATGSSYNATDTGTYTVAVYDGCKDTSTGISTSFWDVPAPVLSPAGLIKLCTGQTQMLTDASVSGETYQWVKNGQPLNGATNTSYNVTTPGHYAIIATNVHNCSTTSAATEVQINSPATVTASVTGNTTILCQGAQMQLNASGSDTGMTYQWQMNGTDIQNATGATYIANAAGNYSVVGFNGCYTTSASVTLTSNPFPSISASGPTSFCAGGNVVLQSNITTTNNTSYQWVKDGNPIQGANATSYIANSSGSYTLVVISNSACTGSSTPLVVTANPLPQPVITYNTNHQLFTTVPYASYQWYNLTGTSVVPIGAANNYSYTATENGTYYVTVADDNGCSAQSAGYVVNDIVHIGVKNITSASIKVYPNPASTYVHIESPVEVNAYITAVDGRVVLQQNKATDINVANLADGIYTLRITDAAGNQLKMEKLVKAH